MRANPEEQRLSRGPAFLVAALALAAMALMGLIAGSQPTYAGVPAGVPSTLSTQHSALSTQHSSPPTATWEVVTPTVTANNLLDVYMASPSNGWAVGENGTLLRYNGSGWQVVNIGTTDRLVDLYMVNDTNGYMIAWTDFGSEIYKYDGTSWTSNYTTTLTLNSIDGSSASNVWAAGLNSTVHWDGTQWTFVPIPVERMLFSINVVGDNDMWAFGQYEPVSGHGLILHNTGSGWVQVTSPSPQTLFGSAFTAPNDGWAVGTAVTTTYILRWDGASWTWAYTNSFGLFDIFMLSPADGWATGHSVDGPSIAHFDGTDFVLVPGPVKRVFLNSVYMSSPGDGWIVGDEGTILRYRDQASTPTVTPTVATTATRTSTRTPTVTASTTTSIVPTSTLTRTPTPCTLTFSDVQPSDYFYESVRYLSCHGVISGYADGTFRPYNNTTRGQLCKIVVLAEEWPLDCPPEPTFVDVPVSDPFYCYIETIARRGDIISGYVDGTFRPYNNVTRGQLSKIIVLAEEWPVECPTTPHFTDVPPDNPFYCFIETAYDRGIIAGYSDGTFRPGNNATRGQISKIVYQAITTP